MRYAYGLEVRGREVTAAAAEITAARSDRLTPKEDGTQSSYCIPGERGHPTAFPGNVVILPQCPFVCPCQNRGARTRAATALVGLQGIQVVTTACIRTCRITVKESDTPTTGRMGSVHRQTSTVGIPTVYTRGVPLKLSCLGTSAAAWRLDQASNFKLSSLSFCLVLG